MKKSGLYQNVVQTTFLKIAIMRLSHQREIALICWTRGRFRMDLPEGPTLTKFLMQRMKFKRENLCKTENNDVGVPAKMHAPHRQGKSHLDNAVQKIAFD